MNIFGNNFRPLFHFTFNTFQFLYHLIHVAPSNISLLIPCNNGIEILKLTLKIPKPKWESLTSFLLHRWWEDLPWILIASGVKGSPVFTWYWFVQPFIDKVRMNTLFLYLYVNIDPLIWTNSASILDKIHFKFWNFALGKACPPFSHSS